MSEWSRPSSDEDDTDSADRRRPRGAERLWLLIQGERPDVLVAELDTPEPGVPDGYELRLLRNGDVFFVRRFGSREASDSQAARLREFFMQAALARGGR